MTSASTSAARAQFAFVRAFLVLICAAFVGGISAAQAQDHSGVLVLGRISDDPKSHYEPLKRLLDYVVPRMRDVGIREGKVLMAKDAQQMASYLRRGQVDWVTETAATAMQLQERARAQPLLLTERNGVSQYRSVIFARRDSGIGDLGQLRGRSIAFQSTASTSAYFVPTIELLRRDLSLSLLLSPMDRPSGDDVGYVFARSELNIGAWVHKRLVDAGAMSELDWNDPVRLPPSYRRDLLVIHTSEPIPRALEMVRGDLEPRVRERLAEVLMQAANDPQAREPLKYFFRTTRFLPLDAPTRQGLERLREGVVRVRQEVE
ncbi:MAG: phosphate/phosphite/phosphonate ABC transporter substrate-binding protein [Lysobacter sp.]|nr:phosphate/phosphite/phosphonate ABC transporter substrate-binding protein [Lysobacter sp.]